MKNKKEFAGSRIELYLIKSEARRVQKGREYCFMYEVERLPETLAMLARLHNRIAIRHVRKKVSYKRTVK